MEVALINLLAPLLPALLEKGQQAAEDVIEAVGGEAWGRVKAIWSKLRPKVDQDEAVKEAASAVATDPQDEAAKGALQFQLRNLLAADPQLAQELKDMLQEGQSAGVFADNGAVVITGGVSADRGGIAVGGTLHGGAQAGWRGD
jgi:hypothetical protein